MIRWSQARGFLFAMIMGLLASCAPVEVTVPSNTATATTVPVAQQIHTQGYTPTHIATLAPLTPTPHPTREPSPLPPLSNTPTPRPTATLGACSDRAPRDDGFLAQVTRDFGLSRDYEPGDLVPLSDYFPNRVTLGYPTMVRATIIEPLQRIIQAMQDDGLAPQIVSGYRSYSAQSLALRKWLEQYPDWANNLSAPPGHSEHQLGTTVDFGSPDLKVMLGEDYVQFHPAFAQTGEGQWLAEHAPEFGFTMSYPADAFERTTFYYEPWHFRYVGTELAIFLAAEDLTISEFLHQEQAIPCLPE